MNYELTDYEAFAQKIGAVKDRSPVKHNTYYTFF